PSSISSPISATGISADGRSGNLEASGLALGVLRNLGLLLRHHAERAIGARDGDTVRLHETLREAESAAGLDDIGLDGQPLPDLGAANEINRHADGDERMDTAHFVAATVPHGLVGQ